MTPENRAESDRAKRVRVVSDCRFKGRIGTIVRVEDGEDDITQVLLDGERIPRLFWSTELRAFDEEQQP